jgi:hypothetical protein
MSLPSIGVSWSDKDVLDHCTIWGRPDLWKKYLDNPTRRPFISDGPSCCPRYIGIVDLYPAAAEHDLDYFLGEEGNERGRFFADIRLAKNVVDRCGGSPDLAMMMLNMVRVGGREDIPTSYRWGFGQPE